MAKRINKKVELTPPVKRRLTPGDAGEAAVADQEDLEAGFRSGDMVGIYFAVEDHAANIRAIARQRLANECVDISNDPELQRHLAIMYLENELMTGAATDLSLAEEVEVPFKDRVPETTSEQEFLAELNNDLASSGLSSISEASTSAPLTLQMMIMKNLPQKLCGSDATMVYDRFHESFAADSLEEIESIRAAPARTGNVDENEPSFDPLGKWTILWAIFLAFIVEFLALLALKNIAGLFSKWPLKPLYRILRAMIQRIIKKISTWVLGKVFDADNEEVEEDRFRAIQLQQAMLFAQGKNPLITIGDMMGIL